jgi:hypothetical protein
MHNAFISGVRAGRAADRALNEDVIELSQAAPQLATLELRDVLAALARLPGAARSAGSDRT